MQRHIRPQLRGDPPRHRVDLRITVVEPGNEQGRQLEPHTGPVPNVTQRVEHGRQRRAGHLAIEVLGECLQIHVGGIEVGEELTARRPGHVAGSDGNGAHTERVAGLGDVDGILEEDHRVVVGERDAPALEAHGRTRQILR